MEIISIIKGFVTNSSSANYWLNDEVLKDKELRAYLENLNKKEEISDIQLSDKSQEALQGYTIRQNTLISETTQTFTIWLFYSFIMIIILTLKQLPKIKSKFYK